MYLIIYLVVPSGAGTNSRRIYRMIYANPGLKLVGFRTTGPLRVRVRVPVSKCIVQFFVPLLCCNVETEWISI